MIYRTTTFLESEDVSGVLGDTNNDSLFPKVIYTDGSYVVLNNSAEQTGYSETGNETRILYPEADLGVEFGSDFGAVIFLSRNANYVFSRNLPAPTIVSSSVDGNDNPVIEWDSSYSIPTRVYRTDVYTGSQPSEYDLIAEVDGYTTSGGTSTFTDVGITVTSGESVDYFVENENGTSDIETITVA